ncbi:hypothetical protein ERD78_17185 [Allopusillimonas soli]|uniref:Acid-shock protein n=1 Tax=Allopusillimonas soli TaxID=659016 RepID=A0A853FFD4_9BURK|nr:hypothetical protein [Allopusillimonas soli]NYT38597.1 hypothetical protein [Allopusillimonas soli]TEA71689.1 hypothetical protein ERD78_17185 [Allopusillimonas soli]
MNRSSRLAITLATGALTTGLAFGIAPLAQAATQHAASAKHATSHHHKKTIKSKAHKTAAPAASNAK